MRRFLVTSIAFTLGLAGVLFVAERVLGSRAARNHGHGLIGPEVFVSIEHANERSDKIRVIYLGDSVAHQLFPPGAEGRKDERFLACNQAISMAGQYYLLQDALASCPNVRDVYLLYYPGSFGNNLGPPFTNDYFCGYFHKRAQIGQVFHLTRDYRLLAVQTGRYLLPNIMGFNSGTRSAMYLGNGAAEGNSAQASGAAAEPLLDGLNKVCGSQTGRAFDVRQDASGRRLVALSPVSRWYLQQARTLCKSHGAVLHVLPCPCSNAQAFDDVDHVYDGPILYVDRARFADSIHLRRPYLNGVRQQIIQMYKLEPDRSPQAALGG